MEEKLLAILKRYVSDLPAQSILEVTRQRSGWSGGPIAPERVSAILSILTVGLRAYVLDPAAQGRCLAEVRTSLEAKGARRDDVLAIASEADILTVRATTRGLCTELGFSDVDQTKIVTAVSELARNIVKYVGRGEIHLKVVRSRSLAVDGLEVVARDSGPGIPNLPEILGGTYKSKTGMGKGILGVKRLMDEFSIDSGAGRGTTVRARKNLRGS